MIRLVGKGDVCVRVCCVCTGMKGSPIKFTKLKLKTQLEFIKYIHSLSHYRRENLFLNALIVLAIIGAISAMRTQQKKDD